MVPRQRRARRHRAHSAPLYAGPQEQRRLQAAAPGLDLVVDYGWLAIIAWPLFWLLQKFHGLSGNWGVAIILLTVLIKLVFFPLSAASYKSMAKMKLVTPRLTKIREMYGDDRQKMNQAMMELYKTEKINPLGGCFPIVVQIPVFIALYWVLLAAIELRHAPFMLWIHDLAALDPYYVLPILMTVTMVLQTQHEPGAAGSGAGEGDEVHAVRVQHLLLLLPRRPGALLAGQQHPFDPPAVADPAHVRSRQACPCQAMSDSPPRATPSPRSPRRRARRHRRRARLRAAALLRSRDRVARRACRRRGTPTIARSATRAASRSTRASRCTFPAPHSYTGEDVLELQGHGGPGRDAGAARAPASSWARASREPGEFTRRAFLEGKLDLAQAEAVADLIDAASREAARAALRSLSGEFSRRDRRARSRS